MGSQTTRFFTYKMSNFGIFFMYCFQKIENMKKFKIPKYFYLISYSDTHKTTHAPEG